MSAAPRTPDATTGSVSRAHRRVAITVAVIASASVALCSFSVQPHVSGYSNCFSSSCIPPYLTGRAKRIKYTEAKNKKRYKYFFTHPHFVAARRPAADGALTGGLGQGLNSGISGGVA